MLAGVLMGFAFNTKMLQAFLVVPALMPSTSSPASRRSAGASSSCSARWFVLVVSSSWWVAVVALWPVSSRPYVGSTTNNSILTLVFGYNGLLRIFGNSPGGGGGGPGGGTGFGGTPGWLRMFNLANGGQISWLLPLAVVGLLAGLWSTRWARRTDRARAGWLLWGGWAVVCLAVFSLSRVDLRPVLHNPARAGRRRARAPARSASGNSAVPTGGCAGSCPPPSS